MKDPDLSLQAVAVMIAGAFVGEESAAYLGPYAAILIGWLAGVPIGILRLPPERTRLHMWAFVLITFCVVLGVTVPLAYLLSAALSNFLPWFTTTDAKSWLFPVAAVVPAIGHSWQHLASDLWDLFKSRVFHPRSGREQSP